MSILSKTNEFEKYCADRHSNSKSLDLDSVSDSGLSVSAEKNVEISSNQINNSNLIQKNDSSSIQKDSLAQWSPEMQSLLEEPPSNLPLQLISGGILFLLAFFVWAWFGEVENIGKARGQLIPRGETYKIESLESAKIATIAVEEGQKVEAGQLIARLDSEQEAREVSRLNKILSSYQTELSQKSQLLGQVKVENKTHQIITQSELQAHSSAIESAIAKAEVISRLLAQQKSEMAAYRHQQKRVEDLTALDRAKSAQINLELADHRQRIERLKPLAEEGAISQEAIFQAIQAQRQAQQQSIDNQLQGISNISEQIFQSEQSVREMNASLTKSQGELISANKEVERLQAELVYKKAERQRIQLEAQQKIQQLTLEIGQTKAKIAETQSQLASATSQLKKRLIRSPVAGIVSSFNVDNTGKVVQSGETVAEVAPHDSPLVLSALLPDRDAGFVELGMPAQLKFDAYSYQDYGIIPGKVISVSADSKTDEKLGAVYQVKIELERNYITANHEKVSFKPGQTAAADIVIRRRRVLDVLLDPIEKLKQDGIDL